MNVAEDAAQGRSLAEKFDFVVAQIGDLGITIHPQSRLMRERSAFLDANGHLVPLVTPDHPDFAIALEAIRDFTLFEFILERWPFAAGHRDGTLRLKTALKDAADPHIPASRTPGRDTQLELFIAVALHRSGLQVDFGTPDVRVRIDGRYCFFEAKRPKTSESIDNAVRTAVEQIEDSGCPGVIFVDVSVAFNPTGVRIVRAMSNEECRLRHRQALRHCIRPHERELFRSMEGTPVAGILFQDHQLRAAPDEGWLLQSACMEFPNPAATKRLQRLFKLATRTLGHGWMST
jgi:hypothetical protein